MFEKRRQPLLSCSRFLTRVGLCLLIAAGIVLVTVLAGAWVFHQYERLSWLDSFLNAVLIMTGLGLTVTLQTVPAKVFTVFYALIAGMMFFVVLGIIFAPLMHRAFHHFHLDLEE